MPKSMRSEKHKWRHREIIFKTLGNGMVAMAK